MEKYQETVYSINATVVSLNGNPGLCGGPIDFHVPSCQVVSRRVGAINNLFKTLIPQYLAS